MAPHALGVTERAFAYTVSRHRLRYDAVSISDVAARTLMHRNLLWLALALATPGCSPGHRGVLDPIADPAVALISTHGLPNDTARMNAGGVTAEVTGRWSDQGESVEIEYRSAQAPVRFAISSASTWKGQIAPATAAWDRSVTEPGNAIGRPLREAGALQFAANTKKLIQIEFSRSNDGDRPVIGDEVTITIPMPGGTRAARFRIAGE